ncbi:MAG TPA: hypothetical protein VNZ85_05260 [Caulobacter sp.]|nr:hypothetical protein [Caulobacter sp.]
MVFLGMLAAAVVGLGDRGAQAGSDGQAAYSALLAQRALAADAVNYPACPNASVTSVAGLDLGEASFPSSIATKLGVTPLLQERVRIDGCGRSTIQNLTVLRGPDQKLMMIAGLPGRGRAALILTRDALPTALMIANTDKPCGDKQLAPELAKWGEVIITSPTDTQGVWTELWPLRLCGQDRSVSVTFTPTPDIGGTSYSVTKAWR